jgi:hypothetical protein
LHGLWEKKVIEGREVAKRGAVVDLLGHKSGDVFCHQIIEKQASFFQLHGCQEAVCSRTPTADTGIATASGLTAAPREIK